MHKASFFLGGGMERAPFGEYSDDVRHRYEYAFCTAR